MNMSMSKGNTEVKTNYAIKIGATKKEALKFETWTQIDAFEAGASAKDALNFETRYQIGAFGTGISVKDALKFETVWQLGALKEGLSVEEALNLQTFQQLHAFYHGASVEYLFQFCHNNDSFVQDMHALAQESMLCGQNSNVLTHTDN